MKSEDENNLELPVRNEGPERVVILTNCYCESSGDIFVENSQNSSKVTVISRPTLGITDYLNVIFDVYDHYEFIYPTSRLLALDHGIQMAGNGVPVDVYIPWIP